MPAPRKTWTLAVSITHCLHEFEREDPTVAIPEGRILCTDQDTLVSLVVLLCEQVVQGRREIPEDYSIDEHLWFFKIARPGETFDSRKNHERLLQMLMQGGDEENTENPRRMEVTSISPFFEQDYDDDNAVKVSASTKLGQLQTLHKGSHLYLEYDMGTTTHVFVRVEQERAAQPGDKLKMLQEEESNKDQEDLSKVPAFSLPKEEQIDAKYPNFCKALLGQMEPVSFFTMGLCSRVTRQDDSIFSTIRGASSNNDVFFCPLPFDNLDEFFALGEESWSKSSEYSRHYCTGWVNYFIFPPARKDAYQQWERAHEQDSMAMFGPKIVSTYKEHVQVNSAFRFAETFPETAKQLTSGKFRWFRYQKGILQVIAGCCVKDSDSNHQARPEQILRTWHRHFTSVHELLCAVEASWTVPGSAEPLGDTLLAEYDTDLGPSDPLPPDPVSFGKEDEAVVISAPGKLPAVSALAVATDGVNKAFFFSGHADGTIRKWDGKKCVWAVQAFDLPSDLDYDEAVGIRGIAIRDDPTRGHCLFSWAWPCYDGEDGSRDEDSSSFSSSVIRVHSVLDGSIVDNIDQDSVNLSCITFASVRYGEELIDCLLVGLDDLTDAPEYSSDFHDFDLEEAQDKYEGNIVPFDLSVEGGDELESWRGHRGYIRAMAVVPEKYLVSVDCHEGHGFPDQLITWSLTNPGLPLRSLKFWDEHQRFIPPVFSEMVGGIAVSGSRVLVCGEYGDCIIPIDIEDENGRVCPKMKGVLRLGQRYYEDDSFHGHMVGSNNEAILINEGQTEAWVYDVDALCEASDLEQDFQQNDERDTGDDDGMRYLRDRSRAIGKLAFPRRGGAEKPKKKKRDHDGMSMMGMDFSSPDRSGGPEVLAMNGRYILAGFCNGAILQGKLLPEASKRRTSKEYGILASYSKAIPQV